LPQQLKKIAFLVPRPGLAAEEFRRYWREVHGHVVAQSPGYAEYRRRYVQNHIVENGPVGQVFAYAGMAEFWLPREVSNEEAFSMSTIYRDRIRVDEEKFIDMNATISMTAVEQVARPGSGTAKLVIVSSRVHGLTHDEFHDGVASRLVNAALGEADFSARLRGWTINHVVTGSFRLPGARPVDGVAIDCVQEFWFDSFGDARDAIGSAGYETKIRPVEERLFRSEGQSSFLAEEVVFFDCGQPLVPAV
jgi:uncharacterized protein (TIGR02118 family)